MFVLDDNIERLMKIKEKFIKDQALANFNKNFRYFKDKGMSDEEAEDATFKFFIENALK